MTVETDWELFRATRPELDRGAYLWRERPISTSDFMAYDDAETVGGYELLFWNPKTNTLIYWGSSIVGIQGRKTK